MKVPVEPGSNFRAGNAEMLFEGQDYTYSTGTRPYDVSPDGQRFLMMKPVGAATAQTAVPRQIILVQNWLIAPMKTGVFSNGAERTHQDHDAEV